MKTLKFVFSLLALGTFSTMHAQSINVTSTGVGIGTTTPTEKLEVNGNIKVGNAVLSTTGSAPIYGCRAWVSFDATKMPPV